MVNCLQLTVTRPFGNMNTHKSLCFKDIKAGDRLPSIEIDMTLTALVMYAGATWDFHRYHYDFDYVTERGMRAPFMDGQLVGALLCRQLMQWGGPDAFVRRLNYRLRNMVFAGERFMLSGKVVETRNESGIPLALCRLDIVKQDGVYVVQDADAAIELPDH